jgi:hypothetical protein
VAAVVGEALLLAIDRCNFEIVEHGLGSSV